MSVASMNLVGAASEMRYLVAAERGALLLAFEAAAEAKRGGRGHRELSRCCGGALGCVGAARALSATTQPPSTSSHERSGCLLHLLPYTRPSFSSASNPLLSRSTGVLPAAACACGCGACGVMRGGDRW